MVMTIDSHMSPEVDVDLGLGKEVVMILLQPLLRVDGAAVNSQGSVPPSSRIGTLRFLVFPMAYCLIKRFRFGVDVGL